MTLDEAFARFPCLETPRLVLREIQPADADALFTTFSDEQVMAFYGHLPHRTVDDSRALIRQLQEWYARREGIRWGITCRQDDGDEVIGSCGFYSFDEGHHRAETGYELRRACWRQGIMREALGAILTFAFDSLALNRVEAVVDDVNEPSKALLRTLGFTHEGTLRQRFYFRDRYWDEHYFGLVCGEWRGVAEVRRA
jgi:[ribosomal protein S5]-alanine N-acetyltransferase